jgi:5-methyltetrahydropteroyltriglutamate--homocysteine methyltransferase
MSSSKPPFRADHVGSLLRPEKLLTARDRHQKGEIDAAALREVEDDAILEAVKLQQDLGLQGITDGEYRRTWWHQDFLEQIDGVEVGESKFTASFKRDDGVDVSFTPQTMRVAGKLKRSRGIQIEDFKYLASVVAGEVGGAVAKVCIPSPTMLHFRGGRDAIDLGAYPDLDGFYVDLAGVYNEEILELAGLGCKYLQIDDTNFAYLCDERIRAATSGRGEDLDALPLTYSRLINESIKGRPDDMAVCVHMCRGNFRSAWVAEGGYDPVAEILFNEIDIDGFFMEYDDARSGDFSPLRFLPKGKTVILGIVTSKTPELESKDALMRRIEEAAKFAPLDQLAISPQCGFSSTVHGNDVTVDGQIGKLQLVMDVAKEVWG